MSFTVRMHARERSASWQTETTLHQKIHGNVEDVYWNQRQYILSNLTKTPKWKSYFTLLCNKTVIRHHILTRNSSISTRELKTPPRFFHWYIIKRFNAGICLFYCIISVCNYYNIIIIYFSSKCMIRLPFNCLCLQPIYN